MSEKRLRGRNFERKVEIHREKDLEIEISRERGSEAEILDRRAQR